jgi:hypothetical protein
VTALSVLGAALCLGVVAIFAVGHRDHTEGVSSGGGSSSATSTHQATVGLRFRSRVNAVCKQAIADHAGSPYPIRSPLLRHGIAVERATVGAANRRYRAEQLLRRGLDNVGEPAADRRTWRALRAGLEQEAENVMHQNRLLKDDNAAVLSKSADPVDSLEHQVKSSLQDFGLTASSPCGRYYR